jgi:hypothetical protein
MHTSVFYYLKVLTVLKVEVCISDLVLGMSSLFLLFLEKSKQKIVTSQVYFAVTARASQYARLHIGTLSAK